VGREILQEIQDISYIHFVGTLSCYLAILLVLDLTHDIALYHRKAGEEMTSECMVAKNHR
jgi:hypothetical protein